MKFLKKVLTDAEMIAQDYDVLYYSEESGNITFKEAEEPSIPNNEIWYTTSDGNIVSSHLSPISNVYSNDKGVMTFDSDLTYIKDTGFIGSTTLTSVVIPNSVTEIKYGGFGYCSGLTSVNIPNSVVSIGDQAYTNCSNLSSVTIGDSVTSIGRYVFNNCANLTSITFNGTMAQWDNIKKGTGWNNGISTTSVVCSDGTVTLSIMGTT